MAALLMRSFFLALLLYDQVKSTPIICRECCGVGKYCFISSHKRNNQKLEMVVVVGMIMMGIMLTATLQIQNLPYYYTKKLHLLVVIQLFIIVHSHEFSKKACWFVLSKLFANRR